MKVARFSHGGAISFGVIDDDEIVVLKGDPMFVGYDPTGDRVPLAEAQLLAPVIPRSKIVAVGKNYRAHAAEMGGEAPEEPLLFLIPNTAVVGPGDNIVRPTPITDRVDFEGELAVVIGKIAKNVSQADAAQYVFGYTCANDVTLRDIQYSDGQWSRAKGFDTSCPLGPVIETELDVASASITTKVNGEVRQHAPFSDMVHSVAKIVEYASAVFTLLPGDVLITGTPEGIGPIVAGDVVEVTIDGIGTLSNPVVDA